MPPAVKNAFAALGDTTDSDSEEEEVAAEEAEEEVTVEEEVAPEVEAEPEAIAGKKGNKKKKGKGGAAADKAPVALASVAVAAPEEEEEAEEEEAVEEAPVRKKAPKEERKAKPKAALGANKFAMLLGNDSDDDNSDDDDDNEFAGMEPEAMRRAVLMKSFWQMGLGTLIILIFSNPAVDILAAIGRDLDINAFYVSFVLAPLASNASELVSSYNYAKKKTRKTITISLNTLEGAAVMNNTFCLGIFLGLIYFQGLAWKFTAETISILVVEVLMFVYILAKKVQTVNDAFLVLLLYPLSLGVVYVLENVVGID